MVQKTMTKQEEIKRGLISVYKIHCPLINAVAECKSFGKPCADITCSYACETVNAQLEYEDSQGAVLKVDSNLSILVPNGKQIANLVEEAGYTAWEPLIGGGNGKRL